MLVFSAGCLVPFLAATGAEASVFVFVSWIIPGTTHVIVEGVARTPVSYSGFLGLLCTDHSHNEYLALFWREEDLEGYKHPKMPVCPVTPETRSSSPLNAPSPPQTITSHFQGSKNNSAGWRAGGGG